MENLDNKWILQNNVQQCEQFEKTPNTLGLKNMAGVFILVAAGIVGGIGLIVIEMAYKKHQIKKQKRMELARHAADKWRGAVEVGLSLFVCVYFVYFVVYRSAKLFGLPLLRRGGSNPTGSMTRLRFHWLWISTRGLEGRRGRGQAIRILGRGGSRIVEECSRFLGTYRPIPATFRTS